MLKTIAYENDAMFVKHHSFCSLPYSKLIIDADGNLLHCCYQRIKLGNIFGGVGILDIWNGLLAKEIQETTTKGKLHRVCSAWNTCPFIVGEKYDYEFPVHKDFEYPTCLEICLPNKHCNVGGETPSDSNPACIMCRRNYNINLNQPPTEVLCKYAKPLMPYLRYLCVLGTAEPFWKDAAFHVFKELNYSFYRQNITFTTNTNVICLTEHVVEKFFSEVSKSDISFSLDAATPETYTKIRRVDAYELVLKNIRNYLNHRDENGGPEKHNAYIYNNINLINVHEMPLMVEAAHSVGIDSMIMLPTHDQLGEVSMDELLLNNKNVKIFQKAAEAAKKRAHELGVKLHYSKPFDVVPPSVGQFKELPVIQHT